MGNLTEISAPVEDLIKEDRQWEWTDKEEEASKKVKG